MVNNDKPLMRIFCYIPTPRIWKSSITARFIDVNIEVRGTKPPEIKNWLWDFDARPLTEEDKIKWLTSADNEANYYHYDYVSIWKVKSPVIFNRKTIN